MGCACLLMGHSGMASSFEVGYSVKVIAGGADIAWKGRVVALAFWG